MSAGEFDVVLMVACGYVLGRFIHECLAFALALASRQIARWIDHRQNVRPYL